LSEGAEVESGGKAKAGVDDGVENGIDVAVGVNVGGVDVFVSGVRAEICTGAGVCASCASWGVHIGCSSWGVQVCAFMLGCSGRGVYEFWVSIL
jgi:hypothetical protein